MVGFGAAPSPCEPPSEVAVVTAANCGHPAIRYSNLESLQLCQMEMRSWRWKNRSLNPSDEQDNIDVCGGT